MTLTALFTLLVAFEVKHFVADYPFQSAYHAGKFEVGVGFVVPILLHAAFHALLTAMICMSYIALTGHSLRWVVGLALIDFAVHYTVDHHSLALLKPQENPAFWWMIGMDEMAHRFTNYYLVFLLSRL